MTPLDTAGSRLSLGIRLRQGAKKAAAEDVAFKRLQQGEEPGKSRGLHLNLSCQVMPKPLLHPAKGCNTSQATPCTAPQLSGLGRAPSGGLHKVAVCPGACTLDRTELFPKSGASRSEPDAFRIKATLPTVPAILGTSSQSVDDGTTTRDRSLRGIGRLPCAQGAEPTGGTTSLSALQFAVVESGLGIHGCERMRAIAACQILNRLESYARIAHLRC